MSIIGPLSGVSGFSGYFRRAPRPPKRAPREGDFRDGEADFGFAVDDVAEIHLAKAGADRALWVKLKDGRIFDAPGFFGNHADTGAGNGTSV